MPAIKKYIVRNYRNLILFSLVIFFMPIINVLIKIIFTYGTYLGTYARLIIEYGMNF